MTILSFSEHQVWSRSDLAMVCPLVRLFRFLAIFCECLDIRFVILGKDNPNHVRSRVDGDAVRARGARERRQRRASIVIETHHGDDAPAACTVNALQRRVVCDLIDLGRDLGVSHDLAPA
jgi:hypothetical protein